MTKNEIKKLIETYPNKITDLRPIIKNYIGTCLTEYPSEWPLFQKAFHELYLEGSVIPVLCPVCRVNPLRFTGLRSGYTQNCSSSCRNRNPAFLKKYKAACLAKYGTEFASQSTEFRNTVKNTCIEKYGVDNPFKSEQVKNKHKETCIEKYGVDNPSKSKDVTAKIRKSRISTGDWVSDEHRSELELYRFAVKKITAKSYHTHYYKINPSNLPRARYKYHLDHIFSVEEGFKQGISPEIIGHWTNLRMLWHLDNSIKNTKCHITLSQLMEQYTHSHH
jgi:hypothetical protein